MARRVETEYVDEAPVVEDRRPMLFNPVGAIVSLVLLAILGWALFWGPIGDMFNNDGHHPTIETPKVQTGG
jgi:hypothetical protein